MSRTKQWILTAPLTLTKPAMRKMLQHIGAATETELRAMLVPLNKAEDSQMLFYDAMEAATDAGERRLLSQALTLNPLNADALLNLLSRTGLGDAESEPVLRNMIRGAGWQLKKMFGTDEPVYWGMLETRPYMRARHELALTLLRLGRGDEAMAEFAEMLRLNEHDNQGVRYELLPLLLSHGRLAEAKKLRKRYKNDCGAEFAWCNVLLALLDHRADAAEKSLALAREVNPHLPPYLLKQKPLPVKLPEHYALGSADEARCCAEVMTRAWSAYPDALAWLARRCEK